MASKDKVLRLTWDTMCSSLAVAAAAGLLLLDGADLRHGGVGEARVLLGARRRHAHAQTLHRLRLLRVHVAKFLLLK